MKENKRIFSESHREKLSKTAKRRVNTEEGKRQLTRANKASVRIRVGKNLSREHKKKLSVAKRGINNPNYGGISEVHRKNIRKAVLRVMQSKEARLCRSVTLKKCWQDTKFACKQLKAMWVKPNKAEIKLNGLLQEILPGEYKYVGDGIFFLAGKCPDFVNVNGQKKIIELYGDYWHRNDNPQDRIDLFKQYGYETLIIWESELKNKELLGRKLQCFTS